MDNPLLKYSAKEYFFKAALCHFIVDELNAKVSGLGPLPPRPWFCRCRGLRGPCPGCSVNSCALVLFWKSSREQLHRAGRGRWPARS